MKDMKKFKSVLMSVVLSLSLVAGLFTTPVLALAEGETGTSAASIGTKGLVAYWNFDDNYQEQVGGLTTNLGAKKINYSEGIYGKAAVFNGKDNFLSVDADPILNFGNSRDENNDNFSISAWLNLGDIPQGSKYFLDKGLNSGWIGDVYWTNPYRVSFDDDGPYVELSNRFEDDTVDPNISTEGSARLSGKYVPGQEWFLFTITYDGKRVKVYRDNELMMQTNYTEGITFNNEELFIGADCSLEDFFKGSVDELRLYNICLSYDDVDGLYQAGLTANKEFVEPTKQLVAYYPFDDNLEDASTFENDAEKVAVGGTTKYVIGKNGKAITMSKGNYILVPAGDQLNFDSEFTVSFWLRLDKDGTYPIIYRQNPACTDGNDNDWTYCSYIESWRESLSSTWSVSTRVYNPDSWVSESGQSLNTGFSTEENKLKNTSWIHYAATYKDGQLKSFLNGVLQNKTDTSDIVDIANASGDLLIGYDGETFINGAIDELKIFNKSLTETEVAAEVKRVDSIHLSTATAKKVATIGKGKSVTVSSILLYDVDADTDIEIALANKNFTFKSSNSKIFKVTSDGKITGVKAGKAKLTITYGCHTVTYNVTIN